MAHVDRLRDDFRQPPSQYRPAVFWSWNEALSKEEIRFQLRDFKAHGIGGAFAHPRIGMITEYLSEDFFQAFRDALDTVKAEDMRLYIYDENAWPSGFAGGATARVDRGAVSPLARCVIVPARNPDFQGRVLFAAAYDSGTLGRILTAVARERWQELVSGEVLVVYEDHLPDDDWTGGPPYVDLSRRETVETFLRLTYEEYKKRFAEDFGGHIPAVFSDEAHIAAGHTDSLPAVAAHVQEAFLERRGYPLLPNIVALFRNVEGCHFDRPPEKVRYDFFHTLHELWIENFVKVISDWCRENGIAWTGHDIEHHWPQAHGGRINPSEQTTYEFRQWPGMDLLLCDHLRDEPHNFDKYLMYEIRSAANQFGSERTLCEAYGAGGYHSTIYDYKRLGDYLLVGGINFLCLHLSLYSCLGSRKRDCPQSFDYRQPWWEEFTGLADYFARASYILSQGRMEQRILLLNPSTTGYLVPPEEARGTVDHGSDVYCVENPDMSDFLSIVALLTDGQWDFDIGDEYSLERNAISESGRLQFGRQAYETVVISRNMRNMRATTVKLLGAFAATGGRILCSDPQLDSMAEYIDGERGREETRQVRSIVVPLADAAAVCREIARVHERRIHSSCGWPTGVQHMRRVFEDGREAWFIVNHSMGTFETELTLKGSSVSRWDLYSGETHGLACSSGGGRTTLPIRMERCATLLLVVGEGLPGRKAPLCAVRPLDLIECEVTPDSPNMLALDIARLETRNRLYPPLYVLETADLLFRLNGFADGTPWKKIQYRTRTLDRNAGFGAESAFRVRYRFHVAPGLLPCHIRAGIERPERWDVLVNGRHLTADGFDPLDHGTGSYDISACLHEGENEIVLEARTFHVLCEIEAVILRGDFGVSIQDDRFVLSAAAARIGYGDWADYRLPFYAGGVNYSYRVLLEEAPATAVITLGRYEASVASVTVNGRYAGFIGQEGGHSLELANCLRPGENLISVRIAGSLRNLLGPHHGYDPVMPYDWNFYRRGHVPRATEYEFSPCGLYEKPVLMIS